MTAATQPVDMVNVRMVVREVQRFQRVVRMPRELFEFNCQRLANAEPNAAQDVAGLIVECFYDHLGDELTEHTELECFELAKRSNETPDLVVDPGGSAVPPHCWPTEARAVGAGLDPDSLEQGDPA